jgi:ketosteroid isomerase-like protein
MLTMTICRQRNMGLALLVGCALSVAAANAQAQPARSSPPDETLHNELRALKDRAVAAVNKRDSDALMKELDPNIAFTAMNNEVVHGIADAKAYYQKMLVGAGRIVEDMSLTAEPDRPADLYEGGTVAVATGTSNAHFKLAVGTEFDVPLRWTATLRRSSDKWAIAGMHFSANMFENPILSTLERSTKWIAIGVGIVALLVGFTFGRWSRKRPAGVTSA